MVVNFPNEILNRIFQFLSYKDLKAVALVNKKFQVLSQDPKLWSEFSLILCSNLQPVLSLPRLSFLAQLHLTGMALSDSDLSCLLLTPLSCLCLDKCDLSALSAQLLASCLARLVTFNLKVHFEYRQEQRFSDPQICEIFEKLSKCSKLKNMHLSICDLSAVPASTLAMVISNLSRAELHWCLLSPAQVLALFNRLHQRSVLLQELDIGYNNITMVPPTILAKVVSRMKKVNLYNFRHLLHSEQLMELFREVSSTEQLSELVLGGIKMTDIAADTLASTLARLVMINLDHCDLTEDHAVAVVTAAARSDQLKGLHLSGNVLTHINPELLGRCVSKLELLSVSMTQLSQLQVRQTVSSMVSSFCIIKDLDISYNDLSQADPSSLASAVNSLERAVLHHTQLSEYQSVKILKQVIAGTKLKHLDFGGDLRTIQPEIIAQSFNRLESVTIHTEATILSKKAELELFKQMGEETCLRKMDLRCRDLSRIPAGDIARAVNNLTEANLMESKFSDNQILCIFTKMSQKTCLRYLDIRECDIRSVPKNINEFAKQKCHFILHDFDKDLKNRIVKERIFGNYKMT